MSKLVTIFFLCTVLAETSAQERTEEPVINDLALLVNDPNNVPATPEQVIPLVTAATASRDTANALSPLSSDNVISIPLSYIITPDQLPKAVTETLKKRYYNRGLKITHLLLIQLRDSERFYSVNLVSERMALLVILDESGRVFKAELQ